MIGWGRVVQASRETEGIHGSRAEPIPPTGLRAIFGVSGGPERIEVPDPATTMWSAQASALAAAADDTVTLRISRQPETAGPFQGRASSGAVGSA